MDPSLKRFGTSLGGEVPSLETFLRRSMRMVDKGKNWLKEILDDATSRIDALPDWAISPDVRKILRPSKPAKRDENISMRERSGKVNSDKMMVGFLYELMRDHLPVGTVERLIRNNAVEGCDEFNFSNGWLAEIAKDMAKRIQ